MPTTFPPAAVPHPPYVSGFYYATQNGVLGGGVQSNNVYIYMYPIFIASPIVISELGACITTAGGAGSLFQVGIYANSATTSRPTGNPVATTPTGAGNGLVGTSATSVSGACYVGGVSGNATLTPGIYWAAIIPNASATGTIRFASIVNTQVWAAYFSGSKTITNVFQAGTPASGMSIQYTTPTYGTWPSLTGTTDASYTEDASSRGGVVIIRAN